MVKGIRLVTLLLAFIFFGSCKPQNKSNPSKDAVPVESKDGQTSRGPSQITRAIKQDQNGNIWMAAFDGIFRFDGTSFTNITRNVSSARFFSVLEDRKGNFWFASVGSGVYYYDGTSFQNFTTKEGLANNTVTSIYEDKTGTVWFGTEGGVSYYDGRSFSNLTTKEGLANDDVNAIIEDKTGKFWFGTRGKACFYDGKTFTVFTHNDKPFTNVRSIVQDKEGNVWLGGNDGLWRYNGSTFTNFTKNFVGYIYEDKKGNIWTSSQINSDMPGLGRWLLSRYNENSLYHEEPTVTEISLEYAGNQGMLFGILEADDGNILFGALDGVYQYDGNSISKFKVSDNAK